jgi:enoyl reductase-like protein
VDEPIADILDGIHEGLIKLLQKQNKNANIPKVEYIGLPPPKEAKLDLDV